MIAIMEPPFGSTLSGKPAEKWVSNIHHNFAILL